MSECWNEAVHDVESCHFTSAHTPVVRYTLTRQCYIILLINAVSTTLPDSTSNKPVLSHTGSRVSVYCIRSHQHHSTTLDAHSLPLHTAYITAVHRLKHTLQWTQHLLPHSATSVKTGSSDITTATTAATISKGLSPRDLCRTQPNPNCYYYNYYYLQFV